MWRRNNIPEPQMGYQAYPEPQMDERYLETIVEVESLYSRRSSVAATALPELPFRAVPPMNDCESVYSDEGVSPIVSHFDPRQQSARPNPISTTPGNVSPISPQDASHPAGSDTSLVSPIEPSATTMTPPKPEQQSAPSQIPRRFPVAPAQRPPTTEEEIPRRWNLRDKRSEETRWDEYSGEPDQAGRPPSVRPGAAPSLLQQYPQLKERTRQILAGLKEREAASKSTWEKAPPPATTDSLDNPVRRPPWKGASGRHAIVEPVKNTPQARTRPLMLVERHKKAEAEARSATPEVNPNPQGSNPRSPIDAVSVAASTLPSVRSVPSVESIKPVAPLKGRNTPRVFSPAHTEHPRSLDSPFQSPGPAPPIYDPAPSPAPSTVHEPSGDSPTLGSTTSLSGVGRSSSEESLDTSLRPNPLRREPDTRSSWNTYATSTAEDEPSCPQSPIAREELTSSPTPMATPSGPEPTPIILRKRVATNNSGYGSYDSHGGISPFSNISARKSSSSILRKAVGSSEKPRSMSLMSLAVGKSLPPTPVELQASDKASSLEARLDGLARRKRNLHKIIMEMHESLRRNAIIYDARKRKEVDKMIINLGQEIQEITNEEHEVGLKLHRVNKRRDKDDFYEEPTGLWIKRVTT